nr:TNT domain-containing protein [Mycobacterium sp. 852002-51057_SCH5723018]
MTLAAAAINACRQCGARLQQGAANYSRAEADSRLGGGADVLQAPPDPPTIAPPGPPGTWGKGEPPPLLWAVVQSFVDDVWPDGDVEGLHAAAARWRSFGAAAGGMRGAVNASKSLFDGQHIPEGGLIDEGLSKIAGGMGKIGELSEALARKLDDFANGVSRAQNAIRDLLNRLGSLTDIGHDLMLIVKGDAFEEIKKIAGDINDVLHHFGEEARAMEQSIKMGMQVVDGEVVKLEKYVRGELKNFLGDAVGNQVATVFDTWLNANEGVLKGAVGMAQAIGELDPRWFLLDPKGAADTWANLGKSLWKGSLINALFNPQEASETQLQQLKGLLHLDDWSTARPGLGFGENLFDLSTLLIPGGGEAGAAADGAGAAARGAEAAGEAAGTAGRAGERAAGGVAGAAGARGALADIAGTGSKLTKDLEGVTGNLPKIEPPPVGGRPVGLPPGKLPDAPVGPAPHAPDAAPGAPHGPTASPGPTASEPPGPPGGQPAPAPAGGPHEPGGGPPASAPAPTGGAHEPPPEPAPAAPAPASPPGGPHEPGFDPPAAAAPASGGPHEPGFDPPAAAAPAPGGPHGVGSLPESHSPEPPLPAGGDPHGPGVEPESVPAQPGATPGGPHDPGAVSESHSPEPPLPAGGGPHEPGFEPESAPAQADATPGDPHDPDLVPAGGPHEPVPEPAGGPHEPVSEPAGGPHEPASVPAGGPHDPAPAAAPVSAPAAVPAAVGDRLPSAVPAAAESTPARLPATPSGSPVGPAPVAAHSAQPTPSLSASTPHSAPPGGRPTELPPPGRGGRHGTGEGGSPGGPPHRKPPPGGGPHAPGDQGPPRDGPGSGADDQAHDQPSPDGADDGQNPGKGKPPTAREVFPEANEYGDLTKDQYEHEFVDENGQTRYPEENDPEKPYAVPGTVHNMTPTEIMNELDGNFIDRIGHPRGRWLAPEGTPYEGRSLPCESLDLDYHVYKVHAEVGLPRGWVIEKSTAAPWFGHGGGGIQYRLVPPRNGKASVEELEGRGFLEDVGHLFFGSGS